MSQKNDNDWNFEKDEMLIEFVKINEGLYNLSSSKYSDNTTKRNAWREIGNKLNCTGVQCKNRWEQLRSQHRRYLNKIKPKPGQATANNRKWKYADQMSFLKVFMKDGARVTGGVQEEIESQESLLETIKEENNDDEIEEVEEEDEDQINNESQEIEDSAATRIATSNKTVKKRKPQSVAPIKPSPNPTASESLMAYILNERKKEQKNNREESHRHELDQFFLLMASTTKKFNALDQHYIKTKMFNLVSEMEAKYLIQNYSHQNVQDPSPQPSPSTPLYSTTSSSFPSPSYINPSVAPDSDVSSNHSEYDL